MENSVGFGGIALLVAAVVWLAIFVPGFSKRSEIRANSHLVRKDAKNHRNAQPQTPDDQLRRLIGTQRGFSVLFAMFLIGAIATAVAAVAEGAWWIGFGVAITLATFALFVSRAAGRRAETLASARHRSRQQARQQASRRAPTAQSREWEPNPIPAPLNRVQIGEINDNFAEVVEIGRQQNVWASKDLDAILARRRAI